MSIFETKNILFNLLKVYNASGREEFVSEIIERWLKKHSIKYKTDVAGNIYNFQYFEAPFLNAHLDSVQSSKDVNAGAKLELKDGIIKSPGHIIGGDDLCGVYSILYLLGYSDLKFNWILTVEEESGAHGSSHFIKENKDLIKNSLYGLVIDRRGKEDIICYNNDYGSLEFETKLCDVGKSHGYNKSIGTFSDADNWSDLISCANLSCGYYNPHMNNEYIKLNEVFNCINYINDIITNVNKKYPNDKYHGSKYKSYYKEYKSTGWEELQKWEEEYYGKKSYGKNSLSSNFEKQSFKDKSTFKSYGKEINDDFLYSNEQDWLLEDNKKDVCGICLGTEGVQKIDMLDIDLCENCLFDLYNDLNQIIIHDIY